jgi:PBP4 family serine-type D-alanyl-D-alanine carboxypeptidase
VVGGEHVNLAPLLDRPQLARSQIGAAWYDLRSERFVYERNAEMLFAGASTTKLLTCAGALQALGETHRFETRVVRTGYVDREGVLHGDLVLVAAGDPNLSGRITDADELEFCDYDHALAGAGYDAGVVERDPLLVVRALADRIASAGISEVRGCVAVDLAAFADAGPEAGTGAMISSVAVNDNLIDLTFTGGAKAGDAVAIAASPRTAYVQFVNRLTTAAPGEACDVRLIGHTDEHGRQVVDVQGAVLPGEMKRGAYAVPSPVAFAATVLAQALEERRVRVVGGAALTPVAAYDDAGTVALHRSPPLREAVKVVLKVSQNLHAEMLVRAGQGYGATRELIASMGLEDAGVYQGDGCGAAGTFTAHFMCRFLAGVRQRSYADAFERALPVLGRDGTLHDVQRGSRAAAAGAIRAKTGTMAHPDRIFGRTLVASKALAGYLTSASGAELAFAIFAQHVPGTVDAAGELLGEMAVAAYEAL